MRDSKAFQAISEFRRTLGGFKDVSEALGVSVAFKGV